MLTSVPMALGPAWLNPDTLLTDLGGVALWVGALIIFAECGLLLGFFLPGDSLLFTIGLFIGRGDIDFPLWLACLVLTLAAFLGNVVGYEIGRAAGPAIFKKENSKLFKREYVDKTMEFFDHYGPVAIVLARFTPLVRTFITVTAGVGKMDRRKYLIYSAIGAVLWASGITVLGKLLGNIPLFRDHIEAGLLLLVVVSVIPMGFEAWRHRSKPATVSPEATAAAAQDAGEEPFLPPAESDPFASSHDQFGQPYAADDATIPSGIPQQHYDPNRPDQGYDGRR
ncbi:VTT domain-containing protein [Kineosporia sp. NBRC 101731]|uniref:DedA family protein n=1 Tax=Kineosporia sp. NBRC 101731 TaxID=3032199 RepID=UPI00255491A4|nr:VTT domain-containing protein [Kineosporia sp. NBRC 101731]